MDQWPDVFVSTPTNIFEFLSLWEHNRFVSQFGSFEKPHRSELALHGHLGGLVQKSLTRALTCECLLAKEPGFVLCGEGLELFFPFLLLTSLLQYFQVKSCFLHSLICILRVTNIHHVYLQSPAPPVLRTPHPSIRLLRRVQSGRYTQPCIEHEKQAQHIPLPMPSSMDANLRGPYQGIPQYHQWPMQRHGTRLNTRGVP
jgi:hypothetical protein